MSHNDALPLASYVWRAAVLSKVLTVIVGGMKSSIPGGSSHGFRPAVAVPRAEVVLVLAVQGSAVRSLNNCKKSQSS